MSTYRPTVNRSLLTWGRESLNLTEERAAQLLHVSVDTLKQWEAGELAPTIAQLRSLSERYKRPLGVFFLPAPPEDPAPPHDFRSVSWRGERELSPELITEIRRAHVRRELALELLEVLHRPAPRLQLRGQLDDDPEDLGRRVRQHLGVRLSEQGSWSATGSAFAGWKGALEACGVLVFQARRVSYEEVRGFSISDAPLPAIIVNGSDFPNAKTFTLLHELVHLVLRRGGMCDPYARTTRVRSADSRVEAFCNHVAGATLVPKHSLLSHGEVQANDDPEGWTDAVLQRIAGTYSVSTLVIVRRLLTLGRTTAQFYEQQHDRTIAAAERHRRERRQEGAPPRSVMVVADMGRTYTTTVLDAYGSRAISASDVSEYLRVRVNQIAEVQERLALGPAE